METRYNAKVVPGEPNMSLEVRRPVQGPAICVEMPIVSVVDGDRTSREALEVLILAAGWRPKIAASAEEFLAAPRITTPGCLLVDLQLPGLSGLDLQSLVADRTERPIVFMSATVDVRATVRAMKAGALDVLIKPIDGPVLVSALREAIEHSYAVRRQQAHAKALQERYEALSRREREILWLVTSGRLSKQAGGELGISEITVKAHRGRMMRKMQASSVAELVTMATRLRTCIPEEQPAGAGRYTRATPESFVSQLRSA
jgi:FixJ family two-component response regulator